jgi:hypothetical protein
MRSEIQYLMKLTARGRMAYSLACLETLAARLNYTSPKYRELLDLLWSFTETKDFAAWNRNILDGRWGDYYNYGMWLGTEHTQGEPIPESDLFADAPKPIVGMLGLCALIGESHLYGAFQSDDSEAYLRKVLQIMDENGVPLPPAEQFKKESLVDLPRGHEMGIPAPRSFYMQ